MEHYLPKSREWTKPTCGGRKIIAINSEFFRLGSGTDGVDFQQPKQGQE